MELDTTDFFYISKYVEGFLYGIYSGIFALYLRHYYAAEKGTNNAIIFCALWVLYILTLVVMTLDVAEHVVISSNPNNLLLLFRFQIGISQAIVFGCCDFIAQSILIYRCWIVWRRNIRVVIIPIIIALAFLALWMASIGGNLIVPGVGIGATVWSFNVATASVVMSMTLNALVTGLIVSKIFKVFREVKNTTITLNEKYLGLPPGGRKLQHIMFVMIESGMALFSIQLARVVATAIAPLTGYPDSDENAYNLIVGIHEILNGITPTIILVRVSMGLSFNDETSLVEAAGSMRFAADEPYPIPTLPVELRSIRLNQGSDTICESDDIQMSERDHR